MNTFRVIFRLNENSTEAHRFEQDALAKTLCNKATTVHRYFKSTKAARCSEKLRFI